MGNKKASVILLIFRFSMSVLRKGAGNDSQADG